MEEVGSIDDDMIDVSMVMTKPPSRSVSKEEAGQETPGRRTNYDLPLSNIVS